MAGDLVLIAEDNEDWQQRLQETLVGRGGFDCDIAPNFQVALRKIEEKNFSALVLDLKLGEGDYDESDWEGWELARRGRAQGISTVIVTGFPDAHISSRAFREFNVIDLLDKKDFYEHISRFLQRVAEAVESTRRRRLELEEKKVVKKSGEEQREVVQIQFEHLQCSLNEQKVFLRAINSPKGEPKGEFIYPFDEATLQRLLAVIQEDHTDFSLMRPEEINAFKLYGIGIDPESGKDFLEQVGGKLYDALAVEKVGAALTQMIDNTLLTGFSSLQIRLDEGAVRLAQFPWELIHDGYRFLGREGTSLVRYISCPLPVPRFQASFPLCVVVVAPRPSQSPWLEMEGDAIQSDLKEAGLGSKIHFIHVEPPVTLRRMMEKLEEIQHQGRRPDILYFDGHGDYGWQCRSCDQVNDPNEKTCINTECGKARETEQKYEGFLYFEDNVRQEHAVGATMMTTALAGAGVQIVALSACDSGKAGKQTLFNAMGPKLIGRIIPAVIAMQFPIKSSDTLNFFRAFFKKLAECDEVTPLAIEKAVMNARRYVFSKRWFYPVLYLRAR